MVPLLVISSLPFPHAYSIVILTGSIRGEEWQGRRLMRGALFLVQLKRTHEAHAHSCSRLPRESVVVQPTHQSGVACPVRRPAEHPPCWWHGKDVQGSAGPSAEGSALPRGVGGLSLFLSAPVAPAAGTQAPSTKHGGRRVEHALTTVSGLRRDRPPRRAHWYPGSGAKPPASVRLTSSGCPRAAPTGSTGTSPCHAHPTSTGESPAWPGCLHAAPSGNIRTGPRIAHFPSTAVQSARSGCHRRSPRHAYPTSTAESPGRPECLHAALSGSTLASPCHAHPPSIAVPSAPSGCHRCPQHGMQQRGLTRQDPVP